MRTISRQKKQRHPPDDYLVVGTIVAAFGIRGEVKVLLDTDFPELILAAEHLYVGDPPLRYEVEWARPHKKMVRLKLLGLDQRDDAEAMRDRLVLVHLDEAPAPEEGSYYYHQLIDLEVWTEEGELLGSVAEIWPTGSNEVLLVRGRGGEILLPVIESVIREVDLESGRIEVHLLEGLR